MPITATISLIGLASMAGLPPFNGFLSKEFSLTAMVNVTEYGIFHLETWGIFLPVLAGSRVFLRFCIVRFYSSKHLPEIST